MSESDKHNPFATPLRLTGHVVLILLGLFVAFGLEDDDHKTEWSVAYLLATPTAFYVYSQFLFKEKSKEIQLTPEQQNRLNMLQNVRKYWIEGVLEKALHQNRQMNIDVQMAEPGMVLKRYADDTELPANMPIEQIFDEVDHRLLILGEPGSGKTIKLLQLADVLLKRAEGDETARIPTVFNLSSWAAKRGTLDDWLKDELRSKYQVPKKVAEKWIDHEKILPLLDGLDEVAEEFRGECVDKINEFRKTHPPVEMAICSRIVDYNLLDNRADLRSAVELQPLSQNEIDAYLTHPDFANVRELMQTDKTLQEFAQTPFLLNMIGFAYRGATRLSLNLPATEKTELGRRKDLINRYISSMVDETPSIRYSPPKSRYYSIWLAAQMKKNGVSIFYVENLQMAWLPAEHCWLFRLAVAIVLGLIVGLIVALVVAPLIGLVYGLIIGVIEMNIAEIEFFSIRIAVYSLLGFLIFGLVFGLFLGAILGVASGEIVGFFSGVVYVLTLPFVGVEKANDNSHGLFYWMIVRLVVGLVFGLGLGFVLGFIDVLINGPIDGLMVVEGGVIIIWLVFGGENLVKHTLLRAMLYLNGSIPRNYADFLDYCAECMLLRKVGGGYIFIHRELLEYFASLEQPQQG